MAGQEARHSVGTAVAGGMVLSTFLNIVFIPVLYVVIETVREGVTGAPAIDHGSTEPASNPSK